jgi:hypothetical protein
VRKRLRALVAREGAIRVIAMAGGMFNGRHNGSSSLREDVGRVVASSSQSDDRPYACRL